MASGPTTIGRRVAALALGGCAAAAMVVAADAIRLFVRVPAARADRSGILLLLVGMALPAGAILALIIGPLGAVLARHLSGRRAAGAGVGDGGAGRTGPSRVEFAASLLLTAAATGGFLVLAARKFHAPLLTAALTAAAAGVAWLFTLPLAGGVAALVRRAQARRGLAIVLTALAAALAAAVLVALDWIGTERSARWTWFLALAAASLVVGRLVATKIHDARWASPWLLAGGLAIPAILMFAAALRDDPAPRALLARGSLVLPVVDRALAPAFDRDGDHFLSILGGGDCDDGDAARSPWGVEVPDNGVDEDCRFGDLVTHPPAAAPAPRAPVDRAVLVTVTGLRTDDHGAFSPALPTIDLMPSRRLHGVGMNGRLGHIGAVSSTGRLPVWSAPDRDAYPTGGPTLPSIVEHAGGAAFYAARDANKTAPPLFDKPQVASGRDPGAIAAALAGLLRRAPAHSFAWLHLDLHDAKPEAVDEAIASLLEQLGEMGSYRLLLVGLPRPVVYTRPKTPRGDEWAGGPLAMYGQDVAESRDDDPGRAGILDVYPTILASLRLAESAADWSELPAAIGVDLEGTRPGAAIGGWLGTPTSLFAVDGSGVLSYAEDARQFVALPRDGDKVVFLDEDAHPSGWSAPLVAALRDGVLAPALRARNQALSLSAAALPADAEQLHGATIGGSLEVLGYQSRVRAGDQLEVTVYLRGGGALDERDRFAYRLNWNEGELIPGDGARPFGTWRPGEIVGVRLLFDLRRADPERAILSLGVRRNGALLPVTYGHSGWLRAANFR